MASRRDGRLYREVFDHLPVPLGGDTMAPIGHGHPRSLPADPAVPAVAAAENPVKVDKRPIAADGSRRARLNGDAAAFWCSTPRPSAVTAVSFAGPAAGLAEPVSALGPVLAASGRDPRWTPVA